MSKYDPLGEYLAKQTTSPVTMTFGQIEKVLEDSLPKSAYPHHQWWENDEDRVQAKAWMSRGWLVESVDTAGRWVTFQRGG